MTTRQKIVGALLVFTVIAQNYVAQISHVPSDAIAKWTVHDWVGALLQVAVAGAITAKAYLADSGANKTTT